MVAIFTAVQKQGSHFWNFIEVGMKAYVGNRNSAQKIDSDKLLSCPNSRGGVIAGDGTKNF